MRLNFLRLPPFVDRLTAEAVIGAYAKEGISPRLTIRYNVLYQCAEARTLPPPRILPTQLQLFLPTAAMAKFNDGF